MAPHYVPWLIETEDGKAFSALSLGTIEGGAKERFLTPTGETREIPLDTIAARRPSEKSIMPEGIEKILTPRQIADLLALLRE